jgi:hypothetical protein
MYMPVLYRDHSCMMENQNRANKITTAQELAMIIKTRRELDELMEKMHQYLISPTNNIQMTVGSSDADTVSTVLYLPHPQSLIGLPTTDNEASTPDLELSPVLAEKGKKPSRTEYMKKLRSNREGQPTSGPFIQVSQDNRSRNAIVFSRLSCLIGDSQCSSKRAKKGLLL